MGKRKSTEFDMQLTRSKRCRLLASSALSGYETGPEASGDRAPTFLLTYSKSVAAAKEHEFDKQVDYDWLLQTRDGKGPMDFDRAWKEWLAIRRFCTSILNPMWDAQMSTVGNKDLKSGNQLDDMINGTRKAWTLSKARENLGKRVTTRRKKGLSLYKPKKTPCTPAPPTGGTATDTPAAECTPASEDTPAEEGTPVSPEVRHADAQCELDEIIAEMGDEVPDEWECWMENGPPNLSASAQQVAHFHVALGDQKDGGAKPERQKDKKTSRKAINLETIKKEGYESKKGVKRIEAAMQMNESLETANGVAAQEYDLKAHQAKIANLEKLVELTDTPETKKKLKTDLKMLYMGSPARLGIRTAKKEVDEHNDECGNAHTTNASDGGDVITK